MFEFLGWQITDIQKELTDRYESYLESGNVQIPLYRYLKHNDYEVFLGIPYGISFEEFVSAMKLKTGAKMDADN